jgi:hypothetical protein
MTSPEREKGGLITEQELKAALHRQVGDVAALTEEELL